MENTRMNKDNGKALEQLADIKLAGKKGGANPIVDSDETLTTRGSKKRLVKRVVLHLAAKSAPGYIVIEGKGFGRINNGRNSESNILKCLKDVPLTHLLQLHRDLKTIADVLKNSPVALIGASIILVTQADGSIKPLLIDPAHMHVSNGKHFEVEKAITDESEIKKVYYGKPEKYSGRKESNARAMTSLLSTIRTKNNRSGGCRSATKPQERR
jgi:hypothetical protein